MEPVLKTSRIAPSSFALDLRQPKTGQKPQPGQTEKPKLERPSALPSQKNAADLSAQGLDSLLTDAAIGKLIPRAPEPEVTQESLEEKKRAQQKRELEEIYKKAQQEGYQAGLESAKQECQKELNEALEQIKNLLHSLKNLSESLYQEMEDNAAEVVFEAVSKIIGLAATDKQIAYNITREAIEQVKGRDRLIVRVSTKDYEVVKNALGYSGAGELLSKNLSVVADNLVQLGGCLIETEAGSLDARLEIQLQRLKETLLGVRKSHAES